ncbi:MAG: hypothetical protein M1825_003474 [Sarcosagium campestre]|nr:MAG: hypothetical protein M1825_003474 [Sarcosagium campestre]
MWKPPLNFITLHYAWIIGAGILGLIIIYPFGNLASVDAYFFGVSASTESGLNTVDVKDLKTYQQLVIYFSPIITNLGFINIIVVVIRLYWFEKHLRQVAPSLLRARGKQLSTENKDPEAQDQATKKRPESTSEKIVESHDVIERDEAGTGGKVPVTSYKYNGPTRITFAQDKGHPNDDCEGDLMSDNGDEIFKAPGADAGPSGLVRRQGRRTSIITNATSLEHVASSLFVVGAAPHPEEKTKARPETSPLQVPYLSSQATVGRNSQFYNLTTQDREQLGGIEYRSLKLLLKVVSVYFFGLHLLGAICLVGWIQYAPSKYTDVLSEAGQNRTWWAFYSAQTMMNNLGFTLTADSMLSFRDATFPMLVMSFLALAGNTCYPVFLRLSIWTMSKLVPKHSSVKESLDFLLEHPRRCYTLLFPSGPTWILFGIIFLLNFIDVLLITLLDLHNPAVNSLPGGPRVLAAIFQAVSARHTGTSTFNLAEVHPAVQFSLLVMMYIAVYPIAISIRASNTYEEKSLGLYQDDPEFDHSVEKNSASYVMMHLRNQLTFDLWYIFLGIFCICIAESDKIMDDADPVCLLAVFRWKEVMG